MDSSGYDWNTSSSWNHSHSWNSNLFGWVEEPKYKKITKTLAYCFLFLVSLFGNILIIWAIYRDKRLRTNTNILIANMAVSDLLFPFFAIPKDVVEVISDGEWFIDGNFGLALCKLLPFLQWTSMTISIYSCIFIALDRYYAVAHPFKGGFSRSRLKYVLPGIWIFAVIICIPYFSNYKLSTHNYLYVGQFTTCVEVWGLFGIPLSIAKDFQMYLQFAVTSGIPFPVTLTLYLLVVFKLRKHNPPGQALDSARTRREKQNKKVLKMSVVIVTLTLVSWIFIHCYLFLDYYKKLSHLSYSTNSDFLFAAYFILQMTCSYSFFIYLIFNDIYRANFKAILSPLFSVFHRRNDVSIAEQQSPGHCNGAATNINIDILNFKRREDSSEVLEMRSLPLSN